MGEAERREEMEEFIVCAAGAETTNYKTQMTR
jgi:hypothetical protein